MNKVLVFTLFFLYNLSVHTYSITSSGGKINFIPNVILNFYPLAIGNKWIYDVKAVSNPYITYLTEVIEVLDLSLAPNDKFYFHLKQSTAQYPGQYEQNLLERFDSLDGKVYGYYEDSNLPENEVLIYDLNLEAGDTIITFFPFSTNYYFGAQTSLFSEDLFNKWGITKPRKTYQHGSNHGGSQNKYALTQDIGLDYLLSYSIGVSSWSERILKGCVINGIIYGDTSLVSVDDENPVLASFKLEQNYPNPFNPSTTISFTIPEAQNIELKIFDVLGKEVAVLLNEFKSAGEHKVEFNGSNLSSGIYFYQLKAGDFIQTKKLVLLR